MVILAQDADGVVSSIDPDQTAPEGVYTVCTDPSDHVLRIIMVMILSFQTDKPGQTV